MKRLISAMLMTLAIMASAQTGEYSKRMVSSQGKAWSHDKAWDYVSGLVTKSILKYTGQYPDDELTEQAYRWCKTYTDNALNSDGSFINFKKGSLDNTASGKVLLDIYLHEESAQEGKGKKYKKAADYLYNYLRYEYTRINEPEAQGGFIHKDRYPYQMWLDGLYMGAAFYAEYLSIFAPDDDDAWTDIANQFIIIHSNTFDEEKRLNYHAWSAKPTDPNSFWANRKAPYKGCSKEFWGRGMGWYFAALADVIEVMPKENPEYQWMVEIFEEVAEGLKARQDTESGVWYQLLQYDDSYVSRGGRHNYLEASASCMFTYGYLKGLRLGILAEDEYREVATKAYQGLINTFISERKDGKIDIKYICRSAGLGPATDTSRDGTADYYLDGHDVEIVSNEGKGIGSFIMASLEYERWQNAGLGQVECDEESRCPTEGVYGINGIKFDDKSTLKGIYIVNGKKVKY